MIRPTVLSRSASFVGHLREALGGKVEAVPEAGALARVRQGDVAIIHAASFPTDLDATLVAVVAAGARAGVAADRPELLEMLRLAQLGASAYFNSYMADVHYRQMLALLATGQTWFQPRLLRDALDIAARASTGPPPPPAPDLEVLTKRQREIALDVALGLGNREIADKRGITERTVKAHLTEVFKKLGVGDRLTLALMLSAGGYRAS